VAWPEQLSFLLVPHRALPDLQRMKLLLFCGRLVGPGEFRVSSSEQTRIKHLARPPNDVNYRLVGYMSVSFVVAAPGMKPK
jgi:hypothetical protein